MDRSFSRYWWGSYDSLPEKQDQLFLLLLSLAPPCRCMFYSDTYTLFHSLHCQRAPSGSESLHYYILLTWLVQSWIFKWGSKLLHAGIRVRHRCTTLPFQKNWIVTLTVNTTNFHALFHSFSDISLFTVSLFLPSFHSAVSENESLTLSTLGAWLEFSKFSMHVRAWLRCIVATIDSNSCFYGTSSYVWDTSTQFNYLSPLFWLL